MIHQRLLPIALVAALALAACGGDDDTATTTVPATTPASTATPTTLPVPTLPAPPTAPAAPSTAAATTVPASTTPATTPVTQGAAGAFHASVLGAVEITNANVVGQLAALAAATGNTGTPADLIASFGLGEVPHLVLDNATLFEVSGNVNAEFPDRPEFGLDQSYMLQSDAPDPEAILADVAAAISATGAYELETGSQTQDGQTLYFIDLRGSNRDANLPRWSLLAGHHGEDDPEWQGIVEVQIDINGDLPVTATTAPAALADLDAKATSEAPTGLTLNRYTFDNGVNMFGGFPVRTGALNYIVEPTAYADFAAAASAFDAALSPIYGAGTIEIADDNARWTSDEITWTLRLDFEDKLVAQISQSLA